MERDEILGSLAIGGEWILEWNRRKRELEFLPSSKWANLLKRSFYQTDLTRANLEDFDLREVDLSSLDLSGSVFQGADLRGANLSEANLQDASFAEANLSNAVFLNANLRNADFRDANLGSADLRGADLIGAELAGADLSQSYCENTVFPTNLGGILGLSRVNHRGPSRIEFASVRSFKGGFPEKFLRGCGLSDLEIEFARMSMPDQTNDELQEINQKLFNIRAEQPIQKRPAFISSSHADSEFVDELVKHLDRCRIRFWRDIHDLTAGPVEKQLHRALDERVALIVFSKAAVDSDWVEHEVKYARRIEKKQGRPVLCPIALDDTWKSADWEETVMEQITKNNLVDFSEWRDQSKMERAFDKLERGLRQWYQA